MMDCTTEIFTLICISISIIYYSERDKIQCAFVMEQKKKCGRGTGSTDVRRVGRSEEEPNNNSNRNHG
jgi:hypothetical protein